MPTNIYSLKKLFETPAQTETYIPSEPKPKRVLLVGEADFSFALAYSLKNPDYEIVATEYKTEQALLKDPNIKANFLKNTQQLKKRNVEIFTGVDATKLEEFEKIQGVFDKIIFNFPHTAKRNGSTQAMLVNFFKSARNVLITNGTISMALVDSSHHDGRYVIYDASKTNGYKLSKPRKQFDKSKFYFEHGYKHLSTKTERVLAQNISLKYTFKLLSESDPLYDIHDDFLHSSEFSSDEGRKIHLKSVQRFSSQTKTKLTNAQRNRFELKREGYKNIKEAVTAAKKMFNEGRFRQSRRLTKRIVKVCPKNQEYQTILDKLNQIIHLT
ncbi:MAG: hypothetical protein A3F40_00145 [Chlamydiae bacterium RIFCSPHIGHO2_12_FULL_27_8]|nr:MAG: hypothetical protein A3F40_00145 [Chlamydiae bacterium RIFCSPHIGHO2_12_FULL_27_8]OGN65699.1 MAG: hypothetical protein A2888_02215 [Chlamydiae bacterium RIFCSPLOWO2_01_FULL_28_7]